MTSHPDPLPSPRIYDHEEAVGFIAAWTGLEAELIDRVLEAKLRYLELAGIALVEADEALLREQEVYRHLLPETPDFVDQRETQYLVLVTDLDPETVQRIDQGELAYQESLEHLTWGSAEERDASLGAPELPEDQDDAEMGRAMVEGHGDHWECVVPEVSPFIQDHLSSTPAFEYLRFSVPSPHPRWEGVVAHALPQSPTLETLQLDGATREGTEVITAFPIARDGAVHTLELHRARPWVVGCEAIVIASTTFGASLSYFDTAFLHPHNEWTPGDQVEVALAAFASWLEPAPKESIPITDEATIRTMRGLEVGIPPEEVTDLSPLAVSTEGMACCFPCRDRNPDEFQIQGPVLAVDLHQAWGQPIYRLEITLMIDSFGIDPRPFTLPVYLGAHNLPEGYRPRVGDDVRGILWLQGSPAGLRYPILSEE